MLEALLLLAQTAAADTAVDPERLERLVRQDCGACHGMTLQGGLGPALTAEALAGQSREALAGAVLDGRPDAAMPPWRGLLTDAEARWIAEFLLRDDAR